MDLAHVSFSGVEPTHLPTRRFRIAREEGLQTAASEPAPVQSHVDPIAKWLLQYAGVDAAAYSPEPIRRRMNACLRRLRAPSVAAAWAELIRSPQAVPVAIDALLIGVSSFFRDAPVFRYLEREALPSLLRTRKGLSVLSAGASTGEELYSIAILLDQLGVLRESQLLGIDCRAQAVATARAGVFPSAAVANLSPLQRGRYFTTCGQKQLVSDALRAHIDWRRADLLTFEDDVPRDVVLFRNVSIYLTPDAAARAWFRLTSRVVRGGFLVTGKAEHPPKNLPLVRVAPSVYRRL